MARAKEAKQKRKLTQGKPPERRSDNIVREHLAKLITFENRRRNKEQVWEKIADYVLPFLENIDQTGEPDDQFALKMFDGTAPRALEIATNGTYSNVLSNANDWFRPIPWLTELNDIAEVRGYLQDMAEQMYFALSRSNFYREAHSLVQNGIGMGTSTMLMEERDDIAVFSTIHTGQIYLDEDVWGQVDTIYRKYKVEIRQLVDKFGIESLNTNQRKKLENDPFTHVNMLHVISKRQDYDPFKFDNVNMPIASIWIDIDEQELVGESGYESFPAATWRYYKNSGEVYGRGPTELVLPTIMGANQMAEDMLAVSEMGAMPPIKATGDLRGKVKIGSRAINYLQVSEDIQPIDLGQNYSIGVDREERLQQAIKDAYNVDFFLLLASAERQMTAQEVMERQSEKALILAPAIARLTNEVLDPVLERIFEIETRGGRMPTPPPILEDLGDDGRIDIQYLGPLAQMQARLFDNRGISGGLEELLPVFELFPESRMVFEGDEIARAIAEARNWPAKTVRSSDKVRRIRESEIVRQAEVENLNKAKIGAGALKDAASANTNMDGALEDTIMGAMGGQQ